MALGPIMVDLAGPELDPSDRDLLRHHLVGGVVLFSRNYTSLDQVAPLVAEIHAIREPRLLVAVDQEGGRVQRFRDSFTRLPAAARLGELYDARPEVALDLCNDLGWLLASELRAIGVDFSFAPVLDLGVHRTGAIGDRAFHRDAQTVAELARAYVRGVREAGMAAVGKHFPGHGSAKEDSHVTLPMDQRPFETVRQADLVAFERMIHYGLPAIMTAHVSFPGVDSQPATFSPFWLKEVLRARLGFTGAVFSDDLTMTAAAVGSITHRVERALKAGCDMVLICNDRDAVTVLLRELSWEMDLVSSARLVRMHALKQITREELARSDRYRNTVKALDELDRSPELDLGD